MARNAVKPPGLSEITVGVRNMGILRYWTHFYDLGHWIFDSCWLDCGSFEGENEEKDENGEENAAEARENEEENEKKVGEADEGEVKR